MRPLRLILLALTAAPLAACAFGETPSRPLTAYELDLAQLRIGCEGRHGLLVNSGRITGQARTESLCMILDRPQAAPATTLAAKADRPTRTATAKAGLPIHLGKPTVPAATTTELAAETAH